MIQPAPIQQFRNQVVRITGATRRVALPGMPTGIPAIDQFLPGHGLARGGLHEVHGDLGAATGFLAALLGRQHGVRQILWVTPQATLFASGLKQLGLDHRRLSIVWARRADDRLWATEEALKDLAGGAVVVEIDTADLTETRRLQLAAEQSGSTAFLIRRDRQPSSALTRWKVDPAVSRDCRPTWRVTLERQRGAEGIGNWIVEWDDAALSFSLAPEMADRSAEAAE